MFKFLEIATDRLGFDRAARRVYLENGDEIRTESQLVKNAVVYVSCGEEFRDPFETTKRQIDQSRTIQWRSEGVRFADRNTNTNNNNNNKSNRRRRHKSSSDAENNDEDENTNNQNNNDTTRTSGTDSPITNNNGKSSSGGKVRGNRLMQNSRCTRRLVAYENGKEFDPVIVFWEFVSPAFKSKSNASTDEIERLEARFRNEFFTDCKNR